LFIDVPRPVLRYISELAEISEEPLSGVAATFLARDSIYAIARYMLSPIHLTVSLSIRHAGGSVKNG